MAVYSESHSGNNSGCEPYCDSYFCFWNDFYCGFCCRFGSEFMMYLWFSDSISQYHLSGSVVSNALWQAALTASSYSSHLCRSRLPPLFWVQALSTCSRISMHMHLIFQGGMDILDCLPSQLVPTRREAQ